jgi:hypothetical protein
LNCPAHREAIWLRRRHKPPPPPRTAARKRAPSIYERVLRTDKDVVYIINKNSFGRIMIPGESEVGFPKVLSPPRAPAVSIIKTLASHARGTKAVTVTSKPVNSRRQRAVPKPKNTRHGTPSEAAKQAVPFAVAFNFQRFAAARRHKGRSASGSPAFPGRCGTTCARCRSRRQYIRTDRW